MNENENKTEIKIETEIISEASESAEIPADGFGEGSIGAAAPPASAAGARSEAQDFAEAPAEIETEMPEEAADGADRAGAAAEQPRGGAENESPMPSDAPDITDSDMRKIIADPMFIGFAKGKNQDIESLCRDFCAMLESGSEALIRSNLDQSVLMRVTPRTDGTVTAGVALTERQRMLAREAGMSYREYYDLILGIPEKKQK